MFNFNQIGKIIDQAFINHFPGLEQLCKDKSIKPLDYVILAIEEKMEIDKKSTKK